MEFSAKGEVGVPLSLKIIKISPQKNKIFLSLCYPSDMVEAAAEMDRILLSMVQKATGLAIPLVDQGIGVEHCPRPPVTRVAEKLYQNWMMRTPVRLGGMGLRSVAETSLAAFVGGVEQ